MLAKKGILEGMKTNGKTSSHWPGEIESPNESTTAKLARYIAAYAPHDGTFELRIPGLHASRYSRINRECVHMRFVCLAYPSSRKERRPSS